MELSRPLLERVTALQNMVVDTQALIARLRAVLDAVIDEQSSGAIKNIAWFIDETMTSIRPESDPSVVHPVPVVTVEDETGDPVQALYFAGMYLAVDLRPEDEHTFGMALSAIDGISWNKRVNPQPSSRPIASLDVHMPATRWLAVRSSLLLSYLTKDAYSMYYQSAPSIVAQVLDHIVQKDCPEFTFAKLQEAYDMDLFGMGEPEALGAMLQANTFSSLLLATVTLPGTH